MTGYASLSCLSQTFFNEKWQPGGTGGEIAELRTRLKKTVNEERNIAGNRAQQVRSTRNHQRNGIYEDAFLS